jgi:LysR family transcriptional regulator, flagellar master operon regulator
VDTELLRTFLEVRNTRHFGRAAENLCITQAAVSARIKQLEEAMGAPLFLRTRNNIQLSREGERLVPHAETVLLALARARQEVQLSESDNQQLAIGVRTGAWGEALQGRLHALGAARPELALSVEGYEGAELSRKLLDHSLDIAILHEPPGLPELESTVIGELSLRLYSARRRRSLRAAMASGYVYLDWGEGFARFHARHFGDQPLPRLRTNLGAVATAYLAACGGACYLPAGRKAALADLGLSPVPGAPVFTRPLNLAYRADAARLELLEALTRHFSGIKL